MPAYRFLPIARSGVKAQEFTRGPIVGLGADGARVVVEVDGSTERAPAPAGDSLMGGVPVPEHLGGGFVFWTSSALYRSRAFTGPLEPVAPLMTNAIGVEFGPRSLLLFTPNDTPRAYALEPARPTPTSPPGVLEIAAADADRAVAFDAVGRSLATVDGGRSWQDVTAPLGGFAQRLKVEGSEVGFVLGEEVAWLQKDGRLLRRALAAPSGSPPELEALYRLSRAVASGYPLPGSHALTIDRDGVFDVDLVSGNAKLVAAKPPYGSSCSAVSRDEEGLFVCFSWDSPAPTLAVVSHALGPRPKVEKVFKDTPRFAVGGEALIVAASCSGEAAAGVACVRSLTGGWSEVNVQPALGVAWEVLYWVPKTKGGVAALVSQRDAAHQATTLALVDGATGKVTPFDAPLEKVAPAGFAQFPIRDFVVSPNGTLRAFTRTSAIVVDPQGHVGTSTRVFSDIASAGPFALGRDETAHLFQTTNYGETWTEVARPPFEPEPLTPQPPDVPAPGARRARHVRSFDPRYAINCSLVGCEMPHESGLATWIRLGWPVDPPRPPATVAARTSVPLPAAPAPPRAPSRPTLRCTAPSAPNAMKKPRPLLDVAARKHQTTVRYGDAFLADTLLNYGLRGVVRIGRKGDAPLDTAFERFAATKAPFDVEFVEPFAPAAHVVRARSSLDAWTRLRKERARSPEERTPRFDSFMAAARPVFGVAPGRADGVLFVNQAFSFWVSHTGKVRPLRPQCRADAGYVDARGTLFVACGNDYGATTLEDTDHGSTLLKLPVTERFRSDSGPGMRFFPPGEQLLTHVDAVAVAADGKVGLVRTASGTEPPTADAPAWLLFADAPPVALASWASLEPATSPACARNDGYRTLIQTLPSWIDVEGSRTSSSVLGMSALVRWSTERVCLEAVEIGTGNAGPNPASPSSVTLVAQFAGKNSSAAFVGTTDTDSVHDAASCELVAR